MENLWINLWKSCGNPVEKYESTVLNNQYSTVLNNQYSQRILSNNKETKGRSIYREKTKNSLMEKNEGKKSKNKEVKK